MVDIHELPSTSSSSAAAVPANPETKRAIYVATPCYGCLISNAYLASLLTLQGACMQRNVDCYVDFMGNESLVQRARNILTARFLKSNATHLLFIDADIGFSPDTIFRLLDRDRDVVCAAYPKKSYNWDMIEAKVKAGDAEPIHQMGLDFNINITEKAVIEDGFVRVLDSATGMMLIKRDVIQRMHDHYRDELYAVNDILGQNQHIPDYVALFDCMIDPDTKRYLSEDFAFCRRWQQLGGDIWVDVTTPLAHVGNSVFEGDIRERMTFV